jgi:hypothetical protein
MPVLRLLRSKTPEPTPRTANSEPTLGLEGFGTEASDSAAARSDSSPARWLIALFAVIALAEAVPTALWAKDYLARRTQTAASLGAVMEAAALIPATGLTAIAAPCEPVAAALSEGPAGASAPPSVAPQATLAAAQPIAAGIVAITAPVPMQIYSKGRLLGTTEADSLMLPLGAYELDLVNETVGYRERRSVSVQAGRRTMLRIDPPAGTVNINAIPWAEVWMDNQRLGETPIGNLHAPIGTRELVFRHPDFGERRARVLVTLKEAARVSVDLRKP